MLNRRSYLTIQNCVYLNLYLIYHLNQMLRSRFMARRFSNLKITHQEANIQFLPKVSKIYFNSPQHQLNHMFITQSNKLNIPTSKKIFQAYSQTVKPIYSIIKDQIVTIDKGIEEFREPIHWSFQKTGKQIRPIMVNLMSDTINAATNIQNKNKIMLWAALVELLHIASLVHDDIIDNSPFRRGRETVHQKYGKTVAVFTGNYIVGKGTQKILTFNNNKLYQIYSQMMENLADGELLQANRYRKEPLQKKIQNYMHKTYLKTGALISNSLKAVPIILGTAHQEKCFKVGQHFGIAFQLIDDVLDFVGDQKVMGKETMSDLVDRNITLPILLQILKTPQDKWRRLVQKKQQISRDEALKYRQQILDGNNIQLTLLLALEHINEAIRIVSSLGCRQDILDVWKYLGYLVLTRNK